jgi:hypothetical protein
VYDAALVRIFQRVADLPGVVERGLDGLMAPIRAMLSPSTQPAVSLQRITLSGGSGGSGPDSGIEALSGYRKVSPDPENLGQHPGTPAPGLASGT